MICVVVPPRFTVRVQPVTLALALGVSVNEAVSDPTRLAKLPPPLPLHVTLTVHVFEAPLPNEAVPDKLISVPLFAETPARVAEEPPELPQAAKVVELGGLKLGGPVVLVPAWTPAATIRANGAARRTALPVLAFRNDFACSI